MSGRIEVSPRILAYSCIHCPQCQQVNKKKEQQVFERSRQEASGFTESSRELQNVTQKKPALEDDKQQTQIMNFLKREYTLPLGGKMIPISLSQIKLEELPRTMLSSEQWEKSVSAVIPQSSFLFTKKERECLHEIFSTLSLDDTLCPFETLFIDLLKLTLSMEGVSSEKRDELCFFLSAYLTLLAEGEIRINPSLIFIKQTFFQREMPNGNYFFYTRKELVLRLKEWGKKVLKDCSPSQDSQKMNQRIDLIGRLLLHDQAEELLIKNAFSESGSIFTNMPSLSKKNPEQSLKDLSFYVRLLSIGVKEFSKKELIVCDSSKRFFSKLSRRLESLKLNKRLKAPRIKKLISDHQTFAHRSKEEFEKLGIAIDQGLTAEQFYKKNLVREKSQEEFMSQTIFNFLFAKLNICVSKDFLRLLDNEVLTFNNEKHHFLYIFNRFKCNLSDVFKMLQKQEPVLECIYTLGYSEKIQKIAPRVLLDFNALIKDGLCSMPFLYQSRGHFQTHQMDNFSSWIPVFEGLKPSLFWLDHLNHSLEELRIEHLSLFKELIKGLKPKELISMKSEILYSFSELTFHLGLLTCRFIMMTGDLDQFLKNGINALYTEDEALLSSSLVEYLGLRLEAENFVDETLARNAALEAQPLVEVWDVSKDKDLSVQDTHARKLKRKKRLSKKRLDRFMMPKEVPDPKKQEPSILQTQHADQVSGHVRELPNFSKKMEYILPKLRDLGFNLFSIKGSHNKYTDRKGQVVVIPHANKPDYRLPTGTASAIKKQLKSLFE